MTVLKRPCRARLFFVVAVLFFGSFMAAADEREEPAELGECLSEAEALIALNARLEWDPVAGLGVIYSGKRRAVFRLENEADSYIALIDGTLVFRGKGPFRRDGRLLFPREFIETMLHAFKLRDLEEAASFKIAAILIDPGHGGKDPGAVAVHDFGSGPIELREKDINLIVAKYIHQTLNAKYPNKRIFLTRSDDRYLTLEERVSIANSVKLEPNEAIIFVSIHANASFNKNASGYEVWYLSPKFRRTVVDEQALADSADLFPILNSMMEEAFTTESLVIAQAIINRLSENLGDQSESRGIKAEEWFVVRNAKMPSVLIELGFVTNPDEAKLLSSDAYLRLASEAVYNGIVDFITVFESSGGFTGSP